VEQNIKKLIAVEFPNLISDESFLIIY